MILKLRPTEEGELSIIIIIIIIIFFIFSYFFEKGMRKEKEIREGKIEREKKREKV